jgi:hypothetical protein
VQELPRSPACERLTGRELGDWAAVHADTQPLAGIDASEHIGGVIA